MIDFDKAAALRTRRNVALVAANICNVAFALIVVADIVWPAMVVLAISIIVFGVYSINYSSELREMRLVDDERLHKRKGGQV